MFLSRLMQLDDIKTVPFELAPLVRFSFFRAAHARADAEASGSGPQNGRAERPMCG